MFHYRCVLQDDRRRRLKLSLTPSTPGPARHSLEDPSRSFQCTTIVSSTSKCCDDQLNADNSRPFAMGNAWLKSELFPRLGLLATAMTVSR